MTITPTTAAGPAVPATVDPNRTAQSAISADFELFLRMLTAQMKNQDPLDPQDSTDYAVQLATFSSVEQQVTTNDLLTGLSSQFALSGLADMAGWIGMEARAATSGHFDGRPITVAPRPAPHADSAELVVTNAAGLEVQRIGLPGGARLLDWQGLDATGQLLPSGDYAFEVVSLDSAGDVILREQAEIYRRVQEVRTEGEAQILVLEGGTIIDSTGVTALREP